MREVKTCNRCRHFKRRCDLLRPSCSRCRQAGVRCSFDGEGLDASNALLPRPPSSHPASAPHPLSSPFSSTSPAFAPAFTPTAAAAAALAPAVGGGNDNAHISAAEARSIASTTLSFLPINASAPLASQQDARAAVASGTTTTTTTAAAAAAPHPIHSLPPPPPPQSTFAPSNAASPSASTPASAVLSMPSNPAASSPPPHLHGLVSPAPTIDSPEPHTSSADTIAAPAAIAPPPAPFAAEPPAAPAPPSALASASAPALASLSTPSSSSSSSSSSASASVSASASASAPPPAERLIRKRKRNCLSCLRCHRLKVKCDKELPCGRCKSSGNGRECYYTYNKGPNGGKFPCPSAPSMGGSDETKTVLATWQVQHKVRGSSHWRDLMTKIGSLTKTQSSTLTAALEDVATNACLANFTLPGNFPFGTPGATKYYARDAVTRLLASERPNVERYTQAYVELLDVVNPILDVQIFRQEVDRYWQESHAANLCWLSQFLMVIGLGCFVACDESPVATELMMAAEACLMQTPFSFRPTLLSLKTMALMVVAKQVCNATCWSVDSCWSFLGLLVRTAFIYGLPQDTSQGGDPTQTPEENDARKKLWLTILYLDIKVAMCTGMPPLTRPDELDGLKKIPEWGAADSLQRVLYQSLPTVLTIMSHINSRKEQIAYPDVLRYNGQIRELMAHAQRVCPDPLQRMTLDIFLRRCLMVLHRPFALHQEGPVMFPESYWSSLECCITLLMSYRDMWSGESSKRLDLLGRAYVLDFFSGSLTTYIHILREDAPLAGPESMGCVIPPKQLILELLKDCVEIWSPEKDRSVCYRTGYNLLEAVLNLLPKNTSPAK